MDIPTAAFFTHEALFQSDLYENQPFGNYIIGSPAFWNLYHEELGVDPEDYSNDYGYFDRNDTTLIKRFFCVAERWKTLTTANTITVMILH